VPKYYNIIKVILKIISIIYISLSKPTGTPVLSSLQELFSRTAYNNYQYGTYNIENIEID